MNIVVLITTYVKRDFCKIPLYNAVCKKAGFTPNVPYTVSGKPEISLKFVKNDGVIVLAMEQVMTYFDMPGCVVVPLKEEYLSTTGLVQLKSRETSSITRKFMSFVKEWQKPIYRKSRN